jgi:hypothetical protein
MLANSDLKRSHSAQPRKKRAWSDRVAVDHGHDLAALTLDVKVFLARLAGCSA